MTEIPSSAGPSTYTGRSSTRVKHKSQRAIESEDTNRLLSRARAAAAAAARGESVGAESSSTAQIRDSTIMGKANKGKKGRKTKEEDVWCICKSADGSGPMIECGECNDWFHFECIGMDDSTVERIHKYVCPSCENESEHKTTRIFDISTFRSPTPPPGLIPDSPSATTSRKRLPAKSKRPSSRPKSTLVSDAALDTAEAASNSGSDDASSEANHSSAESDSDTGSGSGSGSDSLVHSTDRIRPAKKPRLSTSTGPRQQPKSRNSGIAIDSKTAAITTKGKKLDGAPGGKVPTLPPGRQFVLYKLQDVVKKFFGDEMTGDEADVYAGELEAGLFAGFKEVVGGKETAGARYKTQYTILSSSLRPSLQTRTLNAILSRTLLPSQVACLPSSELASQARADELEKARRESLQQTIRQKEDYTGAIRVGRDGLESVGDERGKVLAGNEERERMARNKEKEVVEEVEVRQKQDDIRSPSADTAQVQNRNVPSGQDSPAPAISGSASGTPILPRRVSTTPAPLAAASPLAGRRESTTAPVPPSPAHATPDKPTFSLTSAWGANPTKATSDEGHMEFDHAVDQSALDLSDLVNVEEEDGMVVDLTEGMAGAREEERKLTDIEIYKQRPVVFARGLSNVNDTSSLPRVSARLLSNPSVQRTTDTQWRHLLPHDTIDWAGRLPSKTGISFLSQMRFNPKKEVFALGLMLEGEGNEGEEGVFKALIEEYIARDRYAVYLPYGDQPPPGATKDIYAVPLRPTDKYPEFLDLLDGFKLPLDRDGYMWIMVIVLNRDELPPPPPQTQPIAPVSVPGMPTPGVPGVPQTQDLQALMRTIGTLPIIPPAQQQGYSPMIHTGGNAPYPSAHPPSGAAVYQPPSMPGPGMMPYQQTPLYPPHGQGAQSWNSGPEYGYGHPAPYPAQGYPAPGYAPAGYNHARPDERGWEGKGREGGKSPKRERERFRGMDRDQGWGSRKRGRGGY